MRDEVKCKSSNELLYAPQFKFHSSSVFIFLFKTTVAYIFFSHVSRVEITRRRRCALKSIKFKLV